jgi:hypothetical protein
MDLHMLAKEIAVLAIQLTRVLFIAAPTFSFAYLLQALCLSTRALGGQSRVCRVPEAGRHPSGFDDHEGEQRGRRSGGQVGRKTV